MTTEALMHAAVRLAGSSLDLDTARDRLVELCGGDRSALEVARAVIMRDGLPRHRPTSPSAARGGGSLRNRTLNLIEHALAADPASAGAAGEYRWNALAFDTWG